MRNIFQQIWNKNYHNNGISGAFEEIIAHFEIKQILKKAIVSKNPVHILLVGRPGSAKTMFLLEINRLFKESILVIGSILLKPD